MRCRPSSNLSLTQGHNKLNHFTGTEKRKHFMMTVNKGCPKQEDATHVLRSASLQNKQSLMMYSVVSYFIGRGIMARGPRESVSPELY